MKQLILVLAIAIPCMGIARAESSEEKLQACNAEATGKSLKEPAHGDYVRECVSHTRDVPSLEVKMKMCDADAESRSLTGDERAAFIKNCMTM